MALAGKVAIVTGSSSGIGAATAILFAKEGAKVTVTARSNDKLEQVAKACPAGTVHIVQGDICDAAVQKKIIDETVSKFGKLDILVNNAGTNIVSPVKQAAEASQQLIPNLKQKFFGVGAYDEQFAVNVRPVVGLIELAVPELQKTKGNIVTVSSGASKRAVAGSAVYCMSKAALDMMSNCLSLELAPLGIRVNNVNPGGVRTNFFAAVTGLPAETAEAANLELGKKHPIGRIGEPDEIARAILFLSDDKNAAFVTGVALSVDGGIVHAMF